MFKTFIYIIALVLLMHVKVKSQTQTIHSNFSTSGTSAGAASNGTLQLWSSVGQPIASGSNNFTQTQAGFTQVANYIIVVADVYPPVILFTPVTSISNSGANSLTAQITDVTISILPSSITGPLEAVLFKQPISRKAQATIIRLH